MKIIDAHGVDNDHRVLLGRYQFFYGLTQGLSGSTFCLIDAMVSLIDVMVVVC